MRASKSVKSHSNSSSAGLMPIAPATDNQRKAFEYFDSKQIIILEGLAGTGKTFISVYYALKMLFSRKASKIILTRPLINVSNESLGFLPGEVSDKIKPYNDQFNEYMNEFMPMLQFSDEKKVQSGVDFIPLAFMRGRNFANTIIIADEMQNSTQLQMKTLLTRIAEGSKIIILGDTKQSDRIDTRNTNGLVDLISKVKNRPHEDIGVVTFELEDIQRSGIIRYVLEVYGDI